MAKYGEFLYGTAFYGSGDVLWIFNRTQKDLTDDTDLAYINYWDLNRIETRMAELRDYFNYYMYAVNIDLKNDWEKVDETNFTTNTPTIEHLDRLHTSEQRLMNAFFVYPTTPLLPATFEYLDIYGMNDIEKILYDLDLMFLSMVDNFRECDTFNCGED